VTLSGSPSRVAGWAALAPPGWGSWDTGRQLATQGGGPWSPRAPRLNRNRAHHYGPGGPYWKPRLGGARGEITRYLLNSSLRAALGLGDSPVIMSAQRVGRRPPRLCLARRAYWTGQGPFPMPLTGRFSTGAQACSYLASGRP
jgi:hypothetical protein